MDSRLIRPRALPKPLLLKDYLLDDMSSCSSNGFKSFPRRQCCTTVPFLHERDHGKSKQQQKVYLNVEKPPSKSALSALQRVIIAAKRLQFSSTKLPEKTKSSIAFLPRNFSKKILKKSAFWKRKSDRKEMVRWKSFDQLLKEDAEASDRSDSYITTTDSTSKSWTGSDLTASESCNSSSEVNLYLPGESNDAIKMPMEVVSVNGVGATNDDVSTGSTTCRDRDGSEDTNSSTDTKKQWSSEEKEQFSPVSVLDCPFDDEEDEVSSPFQNRLARMEGTNKNLMKKIQMFECLAKLEPVNLATRFASQPNSDNEEDVDIEEGEEHKALKLLHRVKAGMTSHALKLKPDDLLLDFFIAGEFANPQGLIEEAEDWINGQTQCGFFVEWEVQKNREAYVKEMEKGGEWKTLDQENHEVALELENEIFPALLNELLLDILPCFSHLKLEDEDSGGA